MFRVRYIIFSRSAPAQCRFFLQFLGVLVLSGEDWEHVWKRIGRIFRKTQVDSKTVARSDTAKMMEPVTLVVREYADMASLLPATVREEITYLLSSRIADMSQDVGLRYARDSLNNLGVPPVQHERILSWIARLLALDSFARKAVLEQIRRQAQP